MAVEYKVESSSQLDAKAAEVCRYRLSRSQGLAIVSGCPECGDVTEFPAVIKTIEYQVPAEPKPSADELEDQPSTISLWRPRAIRIEWPWRTKKYRKHVATVVCECKVPHAKTPPGAKGCGRYWNLEIQVGR